MEKQPKKITKETILSTIEDEAYIYRRKLELYEAVKTINSELKVLNEERGMCGSFGFKTDTDALNKGSVGGFEAPQNISHIAQLEKDLGYEPSSVNDIETIEDNERSFENLKAENEALKKQIEELLKGNKNF